ncbi:hypothetical protein FHG87_011565 [Trinorchestia longiramus]|nr:hypothetical protein FHG87_011565 [Trinorchestia longiramus]
MSQRITVATYCVPSVHVRVYDTVKQLLETHTGLTVDLLYESERPGPSTTRGDHKHIDLAFTSTRYGLDVEGEGSSSPYTVLPVGAFTQHPDDSTQLCVGYYSVVVARADLSYGSISDFPDLRGSKLAISEPSSLSSVTALLNKLKTAGENAAFFSTVHKMGSHEACLDALMDMALEVAVVDSVALHAYYLKHPQAAGKLTHLYVWGPHPPHPILINKRVDDGTRAKILDALKSLQPQTKDAAGKVFLKRLLPYGVHGFGTPDRELHSNAVAMLENCEKLSLDVTYY